MGNHLIGERIGDSLLIDKKIVVRNQTNKNQKWAINGQEVDCEVNGYTFIRSRKDGRIGIRDQYCGFDWDLKINGTTFRGYDKESYYFSCEIIRDQITVHIRKS
jgi:hypothetical protein